MKRALKRNNENQPATKRVRTDINQKELNNSLLNAVRQGNGEEVRSLLNKGADVNAKGSYGETALHICAEQNHTLIAQLLINHWADIDATTSYGLTPLHFAVIHEQCDMVAFLVENQANVNLKDDHGQTPLHIGLSDLYEMQNDVAIKTITQILLDAGTDISLVDNKGKSTLSYMQNKEVLAPILMNHLNTSLLMAEQSGDEKEVISLLNQGADVNAQDINGYTALHKCVTTKHQAMAQILINHGANIHATTKALATPLHLAVTMENIDMINLLVKNKVNVNLQNSHGQTPLHMGLCGANMMGNNKAPAITKILLAAGTDISLVDKTGKSTLSLIQERADLVPLLIKHYNHLLSFPTVPSLKDILSIKVAKLAANQDIFQEQPADSILPAELVEYVTSIAPYLESKKAVIRNNLNAYQKSESFQKSYKENKEKSVNKVTP